MIAARHVEVRGRRIATDSEGYLVDPGDVGALTRALRRLLEDPELRHAMGRSARRRFEEDFTEQAFAERLLEAWRLALHAE